MCRYSSAKLLLITGGALQPCILMELKYEEAKQECQTTEQLKCRRKAFYKLNLNGTKMVTYLTKCLTGKLYMQKLEIVSKNSNRQGKLKVIC